MDGYDIRIPAFDKVPFGFHADERGDQVGAHIAMLPVIIGPTTDINMVALTVDGRSCIVSGPDLVRAVNDMLGRIRNGR